MLKKQKNVYPSASAVGTSKGTYKTGNTNDNQIINEYTGRKMAVRVERTWIRSVSTCRFL